MKETPLPRATGAKDLSEGALCQFPAHRKIHWYCQDVAFRGERGRFGGIRVGHGGVGWDSPMRPRAPVARDLNGFRRFSFRPEAGRWVDHLYFLLVKKQVMGHNGLHPRNREIHWGCQLFAFRRRRGRLGGIQAARDGVG